MAERPRDAALDVWLAESPADTEAKLTALWKEIATEHPQLAEDSYTAFIAGFSEGMTRRHTSARR